MTFLLGFIHLFYTSQNVCTLDPLFFPLLSYQNDVRVGLEQSFLWDNKLPVLRKLISAHTIFLQEGKIHSPIQHFF